MPASTLEESIRQAMAAMRVIIMIQAFISQEIVSVTAATWQDIKLREKDVTDREIQECWFKLADMDEYLESFSQRDKNKLASRVGSWLAVSDINLRDKIAQDDYNYLKRTGALGRLEFIGNS